MSSPDVGYMAAVVRCVVGLVLLIAGAAKLRSLRHFVGVVDSYQLLPRRAARLAAILLPPLELVLGLLLMLGMGTRVVGIASACLFLGFGGAVTRNVLRGNRIPCGCFGQRRSDPIGPHTIVRNATLLALSLAAAVWPSPYPSLAELRRPTALRTPPVADALPLTLISAAAVGLFLVTGALLRLREGERQ